MKWADEDLVRPPHRAGAGSRFTGKRAIRGSATSWILTLIFLVLAVAVAVEGWRERKKRPLAAGGGLEDSSESVIAGSSQSDSRGADGGQAPPEGDGSKESHLPDVIERKMRGVLQLYEKPLEELDRVNN